MTTLVTADAKGRIPIRGSKPGQKYMVNQTGGEWRVTAYSKKGYPSRNRKEWTPTKGKKDLFEVLREMGKLGLELERSEIAKQQVPPCRF